MTNSCETNRKPIKVLVMSVGEYAKNVTVRYLERIDGKEHAVVCLPKQFEQNALSYIKRGIEVFVYDEKKYINSDFEFFGFRPRNCGGVGRQGIAEAVEKYGSDFLCFQMDDDYTCFAAYSEREHRSKCIHHWDNLEKMIYAFDEFYKQTGIDIAARTGAAIPSHKPSTIVNKKIFNNFVMHRGNVLNFTGFAALCSDDQRFNIYRNLLQQTPTLSTETFDVVFAQNQGDRKDGNAVLYNSDCSWKKSFALKMMMPWAISQYVRKEQNRVLFREHIIASNLYPPLCFEENGEIVGTI